MEKIGKFFANIGRRIKSGYITAKQDIQKKPLTNFFLSLLVLLMLIAMANVFKTPPMSADTKEADTKEVSLYYIGSVPKMTVQAQIEKTGVVTVVALSGGVVQKIYYHEGDSVNKGNTIISLSTNYQGGNAAAVQTQIASTQYQSVNDTYDAQKELLKKQRDVAAKTTENSEKLRDIAGQSRGTTRELIDLNNSMLNSINNSLAQLESTPQADAEMIASLQGQKVQLLAGQAQAQASLASADYQADSDRPPAQLEKLQKDITLKQLDLQEKTLAVSKEVSRLQLQLSQVTEALMYPAAPISGVVQRIFVHEGDAVSPGQQLAVIAQGAEDDPVTAVAYVPSDIATQISKVEPSVLKFDGESIDAHPYFISTDAVQGNLYAVYYAVPEDKAASVANKSYIDVEIPIGYADTTASVIYVPLDAIYQTSDTSYLFVAEGGVAKGRTITIGEVYGTYASVTSGLADGDDVIVSRNVVEGDRITVTK